MPGWPASRRVQGSAVAVLVVYALVMSAAAFFHDDIAGHENSRTHCAACQIQQLAQDVEASSAPADVSHHLAGRLEPRASHVADTLIAAQLSGRSPPAA